MSALLAHADLLAEVDGPMLRHGLQEMHGRTLSLPERAADHPDREALAWRYEQLTGGVARSS